ncbi:MAG: recombinase RecT [Bacteroidales bacterium]|jgi:hypothetical protein|nr:recombinase RecT [Bacteroidales bacterium]
MNKEIKEDILRICSANPYYKGFKAGVLADDGEKVIGTATCKPVIGGWCEVYKYTLLGDTVKTHELSVLTSEYTQADSKADPHLAYMWQRRPNVQIRRVAIAYAHREAFPELLNGLYIAEELDEVTLQAIADKSVNATASVAPQEPTPVAITNKTIERQAEKIKGRKQIIANGVAVAEISHDKVPF